MNRRWIILVGVVELAVVGGFVLGNLFLFDAVNETNLARIRPGMSKQDVVPILGPASEWSYRLCDRVYLADASGNAYAVTARSGELWIGRTMNVQIDFCENEKVARTHAWPAQVSLVQRIQQTSIAQRIHRLMNRNPSPAIAPAVAGVYLTPISGCAATLPD